MVRFVHVLSLNFGVTVFVYYCHFSLCFRTKKEGGLIQRNHVYWFKFYLVNSVLHDLRSVIVTKLAVLIAISKEKQ